MMSCFGIRVGVNPISQLLIAPHFCKYASSGKEEDGTMSTS